MTEAGACPANMLPTPSGQSALRPSCLCPRLGLCAYSPCHPAPSVLGRVLGRMREQSAERQHRGKLQSEGRWGGPSSRGWGVTGLEGC